MNTRLTIALAVGLIAIIAVPAYRIITGVTAVNVDTSAQAQKISEFANPDAFITPIELAKKFEDGDDVVAIGSLDPKKNNVPIKGSFAVWRSDYSAGSSDYPFGGMRLDKAAMEGLLSSFGATPSSTIVVYAANKHHDAARLYWQIKMLGHNDVRYLDGGLNAWIGAGFPTSKTAPKVTATTYVAPNYNEEELADFSMVSEAIDNDDWVLIDTRAPEEFDGSTTKKGAAGPGAIPDSEFIQWSDALAEDTSLKSVDELKAMYGDLVEGKKVIAYCQSGVRSAHTTMVLKEILGAEEVYNYDGSWIEWSHEHYNESNPAATVVNDGKSAS